MIYRAQDGKDFQPVGIQLPGTERYSDFIGKSGVTAQYKVSAMDRHYRQSPLSNPAIAVTRELSDDELLTMLPQEVCFHYYWEGADPHSGMTRENIPGDERIVATGASGFGILALVVRGFITREQAEERLTKIVSFLERAQRYHGAWSHYMDGATGKTMPVFGTFDNGGDLVETSLDGQDNQKLPRRIEQGGRVPALGTVTRMGMSMKGSNSMSASAAEDRSFSRIIPTWVSIRTSATATQIILKTIATLRSSIWRTAFEIPDTSQAMAPVPGA